MSYDKKSEALAEAILALVKGRVDDSHCYRNLIDNLYAFRIGAVNGTGKWDTKKIKENCPWTQLAQKSGKAEKEHVVPMAEIVQILLFKKEPEIEDIYNIIDKYCVYCMVTSEEHAALNVRYQRAMPSEFWDSSSIYYMDVWARYKINQIQVELT